MGIKHFEDFVKVPYTNFIEEKYHAKSKKRMARAAAGEKLDFEPIRLKRQDGTFIDIETKPLRMNFGNKEVILVVLHDISESLQLEKEQVRAELAEEINIELNKEIKERLRVEEELNTTQQYTKSIIESSLDVICATDESGKVTEFNRAAQKTFGYSRGEVIGKNVSILYVDKSKTLGRQVKETGFYAGEVLNKRKNGEEFISYLAASVLKNKKGKTIGLMGVSRDITEIRKAQNLLEQSEEKYRDLFENATDLIQSVDPQGKILFVNNSWKVALGYTNEEIRNINIFDIISPERKAHCLEIFGKIFKGEKFDNIEVVFITKDGNEIIAEGNVSCKFEDGKPISTRGIFRNVTADRISRNKLIEKEQRLSAIINNTEDLILSIDKNYNIIEYTYAVVKLVKKKYGKKVVPGMSVFDTVNPEWIEPFTAIYEKVFKGKLYHEVFTAEEQGAILYFESFYNPIKNAEGKTTGIAIFSQDITRREVNERKVKLALNEKEILLKEVHHRVKNNLQVVSSILNLQSAYVEDEKILMLLSESQNRIKSMSFIHEALYQTKDFSYIDFKEYILNLSNNLIHSYQIYGDLVDLVLNVEKVLLNLDQAIPCGLIVNELFSNALKYAFEPNKAGSITIALTHNSKDEIKLIVKDNGQGLPNNFDFRKTESLGLQLVTTLVEQIDGTVNCETKKGKGTAFIIEFKKL
jgi:PAS domain S-box-containing protein